MLDEFNYSSSRQASSIIVHLMLDEFNYSSSLQASSIIVHLMLDEFNYRSSRQASSIIVHLMLDKLVFIPVFCRDMIPEVNVCPKLVSAVGTEIVTSGVVHFNVVSNVPPLFAGLSAHRTGKHFVAVHHPDFQQNIRGS